MVCASFLCLAAFHIYPVPEFVALVQQEKLSWWAAQVLPGELCYFDCALFA